MKRMKSSTIVICLISLMSISPVTGAAQATTFSGQATAIRASALGIELALSDTGPLPPGGGALQTSLASVNVAGLVSAEALSSRTSGRGSGSQSEASAADVSLLGGLIAADLVKSNSSATCRGGEAAV